MAKPHLSLLVLAHLAALAAVSAQSSYVFQLPGSLQNGVPPRITGFGDDNFARSVSSASTTTLAGAFKVVATPNGSKFYILTPNGVRSANAALSTIGPLTAIAGTPTDALMTPDGKYLFVLASHLYVVNTTTDALAANADVGVPTGATAVGVAFSHDSKTAWILSNTNSASTITVLDLGSLLKQTTQLSLPAAGNSIVLSPGDLLYVTTSASHLFEVDPVKLAVTTLGQIDVPGTGIPGPLQFTPDGTSAYFLNLISCTICSPVFKLDVQGHSITSWLPTDGSAPPVVDQLLVAGNSRVFGYSTALTQLWDISPSTVAVTPTALGFLSTNNVLGVAVSNESPSSRFLYVAYPDQTFDRITLADNNAFGGSLNLINGNTLQFVPIPAQSGAATLPLSLSLINSSQSLVPGATAILTAQVLDAVGRPVIGATVTFSADVTSGITIATPSATTTAGGWAETTATLPSAPGNYTVTLCSPSCSSGGVTGNFTLNVSTTASGGSSQMSIYEGDGQLLTQNESTAQTGVPLTVKITDPTGNPLAGIPVTFQVTDGIGFLPVVNNQILTDSTGLASTNYVSANIPQSQRVFPSKVHATSTYGSLDFEEVTYVNPVGNAAKGPYSQVVTPDSRTISVPQGGILPAGIITQTFTGDNFNIPNVALRFTDLASNPAPNSTVASCVGLSRADSSGRSTCNVLAICQPNVSLPADFPVFLQVGELIPFRFTIHMTQGVATILQPQQNSPLSQTGNPGQTFSLKAQVADGCGLPIAVSGLTWAILQGSAPAQLINPSTSSDASGNVSAGLALGQTAGTVLVQLSGSGLTPIVFRITNQVSITSISAVLPLPTSVNIGQPFQPLSFVVGNASNAPVTGIQVNFSVTSGTATLSTLSATTNAQGLVQTTVTAGATPGNIVITATAGGLTTTATLLSHVAGPALSGNSFTNAASGSIGMTPCGLVTVTGNGIAPGIQGVVASSSFVGAYPTSLAGLSITVNNTPVPIQSVANDQFGQHATFQAPCDITGSTATVVVTANGANTTVNNVPVFPVQPGIFNTGAPSNKLYGAMIREVDGSYVTVANPARQGERVYVVVTGLGQTKPALITNSIGTGSQATILPALVFLSGNGFSALSARYLFGSVGTYLVEFQVPASSPTGLDQSLLVVQTSVDGNTFLGVSNSVLVANIVAGP